MRSMRGLSVVLCAAVLLAAVSATVAAAGDIDVKHRLLDNGLNVYVLENHNAPVFTMRVYVRAGSIYEQEFLGRGISHFCEHMIAGGSTNKRSEADAQAIIRAIGGAANAYTTSDHTCYYISTSAEYADSVIDLLSDWTLNCAMTQEEYDRERGVIQREITMGMDEPGRRIGKLYNGTMFVVHPEHFPTIGYRELFDLISRDDLLNYYHRMYVPANMHVVAVGDFDPDEMLDKIQAAFAGYPYKPAPAIVLPSDPRQMGRKYVEDEMDVGLTYMTIGFKTVMVTSEDAFPLAVMASILGGGNSSRLYKIVKEDMGLVHTINASSYTPEYDAPDFTVHATLDYDNAPAAVDAILGVIYDLKTTPVTRGELEKAKTQFKSDYAFGFQDVMDQAATIGSDIVRTGSPTYSGDFFLDQIEAVTPADIQRVANTYFYDDASTIAILKPIGSTLPEEEKEQVVEAASEVSRMVLDNGMTLLIKEDHTTPLVFMRGFFAGGSYLENAGNSGGMNLMARMLRRGTRRCSSEMLAEKVDEMGGNMRSGATEDYFFCHMDVISDNFDKGLALYSDAIMNSAFDEDEFEKEREVVLAQIVARDDDWQADGETRMRKLLYGDHPYGLSPVGEQASVSGLSDEYVRGLYTDYCTPDNLVLLVYGDVNQEEAAAAVKRAFARFNRGPADVPPPPAWDEPTQGVVKVEPTDKEQAVIYMGMPSMSLDNPDWYALRVLDGVMSGIGYPGGWLHETLRGQRLVYIVHAWNSAMRGKGYFCVMAATTPEHADSALGIINDKIEQAKTELVTDEELEMGKRSCIIMEDLYYSQTTAAQAEMSGQYEVRGLGYDYRDGIRDKIRAVTKEDLKRVANKYLNNAAVIVITPEPENIKQTADARYGKAD
jgi:zinc protease